MSGFDEQIYEAAAHRVDAFSQAMQQCAEQLNEPALVSIAGEVSAAIIATEALRERVDKILRESSMDEAHIAVFWSQIEDNVERTLEDLRAIEVEISPKQH